MTWLFYAVLSPIIYTVVNFIDKYVVEHRVKDYRAMPIYGSITGLVVGTIFWVITGFPTLPVRDALILFLSGALTIWGAAIYFNAISRSETSIVILLLQSLPIFTFVLSFILLGERLTLPQTVGFVIILISSLLASSQRNKRRARLDTAFWLIVATNIFWAAAAVLVKFSISSLSFSQILSYESWGIGIGGVVLLAIFRNTRRAFFQSATSASRMTLAIFFLNELIFVAAKSITYYAYSIGPISLVSVVNGIQPFIGLGYGWALTTVFPKQFREDISQSTLVYKGVLAVLAFVGLSIIFLS